MLQKEKLCYYLLGSSLCCFQDAQVLFQGTLMSLPLPASLQRKAALRG